MPKHLARRPLPLNWSSPQRKRPRRSRRPRYNIKFKCETAPDIETIVAFEFSVGEEIPESEWETHFLPKDEDEDEAD
ncbi:DUF930 domain-containing protein [Rhizobium mongolense]|uniref:DUF930 domain-containing protein n=1 Tax=Rhizobium mongolense TaxID=57676 RepID=UPI0034A123E8